VAYPDASSARLEGGVSTFGSHVTQTRILMLQFGVTFFAYEL
jgi:hypothetical protein